MADSERNLDIKDLETKFEEYKVSKRLKVKDRLKLASNASTGADILSLLAFDNGHVTSAGDIRIAVAANPSTPPEILRMIALNSDRSEWLWDQWLDEENDDWSDEVDFPAEYGNEIAQDIIMIAKAAAINNPNYPS